MVVRPGVVALLTGFDVQPAGSGQRFVHRDGTPFTAEETDRLARATDEEMRAAARSASGKLWHVFGTEGRWEPSTAGASRTREVNPGVPPACQRGSPAASDVQVTGRISTSGAGWATMHRVPGRCSSAGRAAVL